MDLGAGLGAGLERTRERADQTPVKREEECGDERKLQSDVQTFGLAGEHVAFLALDGSAAGQHPRDMPAPVLT
ncbi:hypothetical protein [Xanthobacter autotrophicus]|uniref:hypothetical protein n=1 Tax=Xanthobacter autotrophicus TaxID=280 RepID=UPI003727CFEF